MSIGMGSAGVIVYGLVRLYMVHGASFYSDVYRLSCCEYCVLGQTCTFCRFFQSKWLCLAVLWTKGVVVVWVPTVEYQEFLLIFIATG